MTRNHPDFLIAKIGLLYETAKLFPNFFSKSGLFYRDFTLFNQYLPYLHILEPIANGHQ